MTTDPVCGMQVDEKQAPASAVYQGKTYYLCSLGCRQTFITEPAAYVKKAHTDPSPKG
jgi:Cu+-exporting ATPase